MSKKLKLLIVRFSSIGDIVLTTPVIRCLKKQLNAEIYFLTKKSYAPLLEANPYVSKIIFLEDLNLKDLNQYCFNYIIDLHSNIRSHLLCLQLSSQTKRYHKSNWKKMLFIGLGINKPSSIHVVERYMQAVKFLGVTDDGDGLDYFLLKNSDIDSRLSNSYITWCIGGSYQNKHLPIETIAKVCNKIKQPIALIGGGEDINQADEIIRRSSNKQILNFCNEATLDRSASIIKNSELVLTNDTGMMHIAAAFKKPIISFWGCTKPSFGFSPYQTKSQSITIIAKDQYRPCSKYGKRCKNSVSCINDISPEKIHQAYISLTITK